MPCVIDCGDQAVERATHRSVACDASAILACRLSGAVMSESVVIVDYDPRWPELFAAERAHIAAALRGLALRIDHNGSTSVPDLPAKPIIDIQISVARLHPMDKYRAALQSLDYTHVPHPDDWFCPFFHKPAVW